MGKNVFDALIDDSKKDDSTIINFNELKTKISIEQKKDNDNFNRTFVSPTLKNEKRLKICVSLYREDIEKMKIISEETGASLSKFLRNKIKKEYENLKK